MTGCRKVGLVWSKRSVFLSSNDIDDIAVIEGRKGALSGMHEEG